MSLYDKLFDYQKKVVDKYHLRDNMGLFLDMGLGKTILSLAFAEVNKCNNVLIITLNAKALESSSVKGSWLNWAKESSMDYSTFNKDYVFSEYDMNDNICYVVNYESLFERDNDTSKKVILKKSILDFIKTCKDKNVAIIIDESHKMKNINSLQTTAIFELKKQIKRVSNKTYSYLLSGTPFTNTMVDLYAQLKFLGYDKSKTYFIDRYCIRDNIKGLLGWQQPVIGYKNIDEIFDLVHNYAITMKTEEFINLPKQHFKYVSFPNHEYFKLFTNDKYQSTLIKRECDKRGIKNDFKVSNVKINNPFYRNIDYPNDEFLSDTLGTFWLRSRQLNIGFIGSEEVIWFDKSRINKLREIITNNRDNYVVFYNYNAELIALFELFEELNYNIDIYSGSIKTLENYAKYCELKEGNNNVILANYVSGSTGVNWQLYNNCVLFSLPLYKDYEQCLKRVHRVGQTKDVNYYIFYSQNWLDLGMMDSLKNKNNYNTRLFEKGLNKK